MIVDSDNHKCSQSHAQEQQCITQRRVPHSKTMLLTLHALLTRFSWPHLGEEREESYKQENQHQG